MGRRRPAGAGLVVSPLGGKKPAPRCGVQSGPGNPRRFSIPVPQGKRSRRFPAFRQGLPVMVRSRNRLRISEPFLFRKVQRFSQRAPQNPKRWKYRRRFQYLSQTMPSCRQRAAPWSLRRRKHPNPNHQQSLRKHSRRNLSCPAKKNPQNRRLTFRLGSTMPKPMPKA